MSALTKRQREVWSAILQLTTRNIPFFRLTDVSEYLGSYPGTVHGLLARMVTAGYINHDARGQYKVVKRK